MVSVRAKMHTAVYENQRFKNEKCYAYIIACPRLKGRAYLDIICSLGS